MCAEKVVKTRLASVAGTGRCNSRRSQRRREGGGGSFEKLTSPRAHLESMCHRAPWEAERHERMASSGIGP
jgi:hypothetical protein